MVNGGKTTAAHCNAVHLDESWKAYVKKEAEVARRWGQSWGFLVDGGEPMAPVRRGSGGKAVTLPPLPAPKQSSLDTFPMVTSREIGWRSVKRECQLERYGRWGRPKGCILKSLKWPRDAVP